MTWPTPNPGDIAAALRDHGLTPTLWPGWDTRGRPWSDGLRALVDHHTSGVGPGVREWCANESGRFPFVNAYVDRDGGYTLFSALSCWGSGKGGPWPGIAAADSLHLVAYQTEVESWGRVPDFTDAMLDALGRGNAALIDLGVPPGNEINHKTWAPNRKNDTLYSDEFMRANTARYRRTAPPPTPTDATEGDDMFVIHGRTPYLLSGGRLCRVSQVTLDKGKAAGVPAFGVDSADWGGLVDAYGTPAMRAAEQ